MTKAHKLLGCPLKECLTFLNQLCGMHLYMHAFLQTYKRNNHILAKHNKHIKGSESQKALRAFGFKPKKKIKPFLFQTLINSGKFVHRAHSMRSVEEAKKASKICKRAQLEYFPQNNQNNDAKHSCTLQLTVCKRQGDGFVEENKTY